MGFITKLFLPVVMRIVARTLRKMSPEIRKEVIDFVLEWEKKCKATPNKIDDLAVIVVKGALNIK